MRKLIVKPLALREQRQTLQHSRKMFGSRAARAYETLIRRGFRLLCADPKRTGVVVNDELQDGICLFHLRHARARGVAPKQARHIIVFTYDDTSITILRVLHDSTDVEHRANDENET